jgi:hypothetical protein
VDREDADDGEYEVHPEYEVDGEDADDGDEVDGEDADDVSPEDPAHAVTGPDWWRGHWWEPDEKHDLAEKYAHPQGHISEHVGAEMETIKRELNTTLTDILETNNQGNQNGRKVYEAFLAFFKKNARAFGLTSTFVVYAGGFGGRIYNTRSTVVPTTRGATSARGKSPGRGAMRAGEGSSTSDDILSNLTVLFWI